MMLCSTVLPLLVLLATVHECRAAHHYYVTATNGSDCPPTFPCHPLNYYVQNVELYFTSDTVVEFLPGLHELNCTGHVLILLARNLTLIGSDFNVKPSTKCSHSDSIVFCTDYAGFIFGFISGLNIINLHFAHCGALFYPEYYPKIPLIDTTFFKIYAAFLIGHVQNLVISKVTIEKSYGFGLFGANIWNKSVIIDSCFISNNEYVGKYQRCIDPEYPASCTGGNLRLTYFDFPLPGTPANNSLEINNSEFRRGVSSIQPEPHSGIAGGLGILVSVMFGHNIHITINNTVVAENSGFIGGNMLVSTMFGAEHVAIRLDRCYIHSGRSIIKAATGLTCLINSINEQANEKVMPVHISNTKFVSNRGGALLFGAGGRSSCVCNNSAYQILIDNCEFSNNFADFTAITGISATMLSDNGHPRVTVQETVLKVRLVIQNSTFHHNYKLQTVSQRNVYLILFNQFLEVEIINSTFYSNTASHTMVLSKSKVIFRGQVLFRNNASFVDGGALHLNESSVLHFKPNTTVSFINNRALQKGGAIYVADTKRKNSNPFCFYELDEVLKYSQVNIQLLFAENHAEIAGDALYGGQVDRCILLPNPNPYPEGPYLFSKKDLIEKNSRKLFVNVDNVFKSLFKFTDSSLSHSLLSSDPFRMCFCSNESEPNFGGRRTVHS